MVLPPDNAAGGSSKRRPPVARKSFVSRYSLDLLKEAQNKSNQGRQSPSSAAGGSTEAANARAIDDANARADDEAAQRSRDTAKASKDDLAKLSKLASSPLGLKASKASDERTKEDKPGKKRRLQRLSDDESDGDCSDWGQYRPKAKQKVPNHCRPCQPHVHLCLTPLAFA